MKVVHVTTFVEGGAGMACFRLHNALLNIGIESSILCLDHEDLSKNIFRFKNTSFLRRLFSKLFKIFETHKHKRQRLNSLYCDLTNEQFYYSTPYSDFEIDKHNLIQDADIIHLHWIAQFVDYSSFFTKINKPIFWTFHDLNPLLGGLHYPISANINEVSNGKDQIIEDFKNDILIGKTNLNIICISSEIKSLVENSTRFKLANKFLIHNGIETDQFDFRGRGELNIPNKKRVVLFVSYDLFDKRKGLDILLQALSNLDQDNIVLLLIGNCINVSDKVTVKNYLHFSATNDKIMLAKYYSCADVYVSCSHYEAFAQTPIEALMCGTPVVITPVSGAADLITPNNGIISKSYSSDDLATAIINSLSNDYNRETIRKDAIERFDINSIAKMVYKHYKLILK